MRILVFTSLFPPDYTGGAEVSLYHTTRGLATRGHVCSVLSVNHRLNESVDERYDFDGLRIHRVRFPTRLPGGSVFDPRVYRAVQRAMAEVQPDILHVHNVAGASLAPFVAARAAGLPVVSTLHDLWLICRSNMRYRQDGSFCDPRRFPHGCGDCVRRYDYWAPVPQRHRVFAALTKNVATFIAPSQALIERHVEAGYSRARFRLVPYGFEEAAVPPPTHPAVAKILRSAAQQHTVVFAGGGVEIKGARVVLAALPTLLAQDERLRVVIVGGESELLTHFRQLGPRVQVLGRIPFQDMRALFAAADLSLVPSVWHENSPVVIYENSQVGTPVVGSAFGGIPELIDEGETGYLFPTGNATALAAQVAAHFARSPGERRRMRQRCVEVARTRLSLDRHLDALERIYGEVLT